MADFSLDGRTKVKTLKANFKKAFGASLRVYKSESCKGASQMTMQHWHLFALKVKKAANS